MPNPPLGSLARRFAVTAALLAGFAMLMIAGASYWLIQHEHAASVRSLLKKDASLQVASIDDRLQTVATRMLEIASSRLIANALLDDADNQRFLIPYLNGIQRVRSTPVSILFTDFAGREIASNGHGSFSAQDMHWLREKLAAGQTASRIQPSEYAENGKKGEELIAVEFIVLSRPDSPDGALLYKIRLSELSQKKGVRLVHGNEAVQLLRSQTSTAVALDVPLLYRNLDLAVLSSPEPTADRSSWQSAGVFFLLTIGLMAAVLVVGLRLGQGLTKDLLKLQLFARDMSGKGFGTGRAEAGDSREVASLARSVNRMLDRLTQEHDKLSESEERFRSLFEYSELGMNVRGADSKYLEVNPAFAAMLGYSQKELLGVNFNDITHPDSIEQGMLLVNTLLKGERDHFQMEKQFIRKDGSTFWADVTVSAVRDSAKKLISFIGVTQDITQRKQAEAEIAKQSQRLSEVIWGTDIGTWEWNVQTGETVFNQRWAEIVGHTLDELAPISIDTWSKLVEPDDAIRSGELLTQCFNRGSETYECEARMRHKNGEWVWVLDRGRVVEWTQDGKPLRMSGTHQDITERKCAEVELERFKNVLDSTLDMIFMFEPASHRFVYVNQGAVLSMLYSREELLGMTPSQIKPLLPEAKFRQLIGPLLFDEQSVLRFETLHRRKDGTDFPVSIALQLVEQSNGSGLFVAIVQDITERKRAQNDMERLNASLEARVQQRTGQLQASNRDLEEFAYSVAHDLRQPFIAIGGFSGLLEKTVTDERALHYIARIKAGVRQAGELTDSLLVLANLSRMELHLQPVDLSAMAHSVMQALRRDSPVRQASVRIESGLVVQADPVLIRQMMYELLANAWKFTSWRSHAEISFGLVPPPADAAGGVPVYVVKDNGEGFDMALADKLFRSFQRLHTAQGFPGAGVDLVKVQRIVERHHGQIWAESARGEGAQFFFTLDSHRPDSDRPDHRALSGARDS